MAGSPGPEELRDLQALFDQGNAQDAQGRVAEAEASFRRVIELQPGFAAAHNNRANALTRLGRLREAEAGYRQAIALQPAFVEAHSNLANTLNQLARPAEAEAAARRALELKPDFHSASNNLGLSLQAQGRAAEAEAAYRRALQFRPGDPLALGNLGHLLQARGAFAEAEECYRGVLASGVTGGALVGALNGRAHALASAVPGWHVPMMNDEPRNAAYLEGLRGAVTPESLVLEIGTGSGLLAMMAARLGAKQVVTCEAVPLIAAAARGIVAANGLAGRVEVIGKASTALEVGKDLPRRADVLVSEIFSSELLSEGVLPAIEDARRRLLAPGARIVPASGAAMCALFGGEALARNLRVGEVCGFDLSGFNAIASQKRFLHRADLGLELLTDGAEALRFDFAARDFFPEERRSLRLPVTASGRCHGIVQWIRIYMDERATFENHPLEPNAASGWQQCLYRFDRPVDVRKGQTAVVTAAHNRSALWFFLESVA
jgi:Flp pilus assembly protein TadD